MKHLFYWLLFCFIAALILLNQIPSTSYSPIHLDLPLYHNSAGRPEQHAIKNAEFRIPVSFDQFQLDPLHFTLGQSQLIFFNLFEGLTRLKNKEIELGGAKQCIWKSALRLTCELKLKYWSDFKPISTKDYLFAFKRILEHKGQGGGFKLLSALQDPKLGFPVTADDETHLTFLFKKHDSDFLMKLASPYFIPWREDQNNCPLRCFTNGPFKIVDYKPGYLLKIQKIKQSSANEDLVVSFVLVESESSQLRLYKNDQIDLVRRIATSRIEDYKNRKDFHLLELLRFDYLGFGPEMQTSKFDELRRILATSPRYKDLQEIYQSPDSLDCLPRFIGSTCISQINKNKKTSSTIWPKLTLSFSRLGGDDVIKGMEWFQNQWAKKGLVVVLKPLEQKLFFKTLRTQTPNIFRKGFNIERPTCRAILESFSVAGSESFAISSKWQKQFELLLSEESFSELKMCESVLLNFLKEWRMIPLGTLTQPFLVRTRFKNWLFNPMGQLFLEDLTVDETYYE